MSGYIGTTPVPQASQTRDVFTATAGQTTFATTGYTPSFLDVYVNGSHLKNGTDYTASNGSDVVMASGLAVGDYVEVVAFTTFSTSDTVSASSGGTFTGAVTVQGAFTSKGIDDNASSTAMTIDSSGNLLVGKTAEDNSTVGARLQPDGVGSFCADGSHSLIASRNSSDGDVVIIQKNGSNVGKLGIDSSDNFIVECASTNHAGLGFAVGQILPRRNGGNTDNTQDLGASSVRFDDIFATNGTIQTSDEREKQQVASLTDAEMTAAKAISKLFKTFKWNDKVEAKGDAARTHTGVIAQQVETAMSDAGLDAGDYAFFISTTWWETQTEVAAVEADEENGIEAQEAYTRTDIYDTQEEAPEGATERNRKGIRYPELLSFVGTATEQRLTSIEARLDALEAE